MKQWPPRAAVRERLLVHGTDHELAKEITGLHKKAGIDAVNYKLDELVQRVHQQGLLTLVIHTPYLTAIHYVSNITGKPMRLCLTPMSNAQWN